MTLTAVTISLCVSKHHVVYPKYIHFLFLKNLALAGVAQWIECQPMKPKVASLIPS